MGVNSPLFIMIYLKIFQFIKNYWKPLSYVILILAVVILFMLFKSQKIRAEEAEQGRDAAIHISTGLSEEVHKYKNKQGDTVTQVKSEVIPKSQLASLLKDRDLYWLNKFAKPKEIQSAESFTTKLEEIKVPERIVYLPCKDSIRASRYDFHDEWNDIHALVVGKPTIEIRDHYYAAIELKRPKHWFLKLQFSKREPILEITNSNKLIRIDSVVSIVVK